MAHILEETINNGQIKSVDYNLISNIEDISTGEHGKVIRGYSKDAKEKVILKKMRLDLDIRKELELLLFVESHENFIKCFGICQKPNTSDYYIVLRNANGGNLREYLEKNFHRMSWNDKILMAKQIATGLKFIHQYNIIHGNLHPKNIVVHNQITTITDFCYNKQSTPNVGMNAFIEPKFLINTSYVKDKASDIYSLGQVFWEISSGKSPFNNLNVYKLLHAIREKKRETPVPETPLDYQTLYQLSWVDEPTCRPPIEYICSELDLILKARGIYIPESIKTTPPSPPTPPTSTEQSTKMNYNNYNNNYNNFNTPSPPPIPVKPVKPTFNNNNNNNNNYYNHHFSHIETNSPQAYHSDPLPNLGQFEDPNIRANNSFPFLNNNNNNNMAPPNNPNYYYQDPGQPYYQPQFPITPQPPPKPQVYNNMNSPQISMPIPQIPPKNNFNNDNHIVNNSMPMPTPQIPLRNHEMNSAAIVNIPPIQPNIPLHHINSDNINPARFSLPLNPHPNNQMNNDMNSNRFSVQIPPPPPQRQLSNHYQASPDHSNFSPNSNVRIPTFENNNSQPIHSQLISTLDESLCRKTLDDYNKIYRDTGGYFVPFNCSPAYHVALGDVDGLVGHLETGASVHDKYRFLHDTESLVIIAAKYCGIENMYDILFRLGKSNADFNVTSNESNKTALHYLLVNKKVGKKILRSPKTEIYSDPIKIIVNYLVNKGCDINAFDGEGRTILSYFMGVENGLHDKYFPIISILLRNGANPNIRTRIKGKREFFAINSLYLAVKYNWSVELLDELVRYNVDKEAIDDDGNCILYLIAQEDKDRGLERVKWALENVFIAIELKSLERAMKVVSSHTRTYDLLKKYTKKDKYYQRKQIIQANESMKKLEH